MIFNRLVLENYGLFSGLNEFDLRPRSANGRARPIILFGGKNGAGKTTFLDSIRLLFYGRRSVGDRLGQKEYELALISRTHRSKGHAIIATYSKVGIEFEYVLQGQRQTYYIERSWIINGEDSITEFFKVDRDGQPLQDVGSTQWEAFVSDIVPERLSQLFFFDGEKIKSIAEDVTSNVAIAEAIQSLLGLDAVQSLKGDLSVYRSRLLKAENPGGYEIKLDEIDSALKILEAEKQEVELELASTRTELDGLCCTITNLEATLEQKGGALAEKRGENLQRSTNLKDSVVATEQAIRDAFDTTAPFTLCPNVASELLKQLGAESNAKERKIRISNVHHVKAFLLKASEKAEANVKGIRAFLQSQLDAYTIHLDEEALSPEIHSLSERASMLIHHVLTERTTSDAKNIARLLTKLEVDHQSLHLVQRDLSRAPDESDLADLFSSLKTANQKAGGLKEKEALLLQRFDQLALKTTQGLRDRQKIEDKIATSSKQRSKLEQIERLGPALEMYQKRLTEEKIQSLQREVTICFNRLARKEDFVREIKVDPLTFGVLILDQNGKTLPKEQLSSGEKQIFAISLLWGLARTSGRPLPVVVDTPLGRLDSDHRAKLIENYFPQAAHQVILLSTDTEVEQTLFKQLKPSISHCYHLSYESKEGRTIAKEEYFWDSTKAA